MFTLARAYKYTKNLSVFTYIHTHAGRTHSCKHTGTQTNKHRDLPDIFTHAKTVCTHTQTHSHVYTNKVYISTYTDPVHKRSNTNTHTHVYASYDVNIFLQSFYFYFFIILIFFFTFYTHMCTHIDT